MKERFCDCAILTDAGSEHNFLAFLFLFQARVDVDGHKPVIRTRVFLSHMLYNKNVNTVPLITLTSRLLLSDAVHSMVYVLPA